MKLLKQIMKTLLIVLGVIGSVAITMIVIVLVWIWCDEKDLGTYSRVQNVSGFQFPVPRAKAHGDHLSLFYKSGHGLETQEYCSLKPVHKL